MHQVSQTGNSSIFRVPSSSSLLSEDGRGGGQGGAPHVLNPLVLESSRPVTGDIHRTSLIVWLDDALCAQPAAVDTLVIRSTRRLHVGYTSATRRLDVG